MMKRHLYYFNWQLSLTLFGSVLDDLEKADIVDEVYFLRCNGVLKPCWSNNTACELLCSRCRFNHKSGFNSIKRKVIQLQIEDFIDRAEIEQIFKQIDLRYNSIEEIKKIKYKGVRIGYGALSSYISWTRNSEPIMNGEFRSYFELLLKSEILLKEAIDNVLKKVSPDVISIFNGRTADVRPVFETAISKGIQLRGIENIMPKETEYRKIIFDNVLPHNIDWHTEKIKTHWDTSGKSIEEKNNSAASFFEKRRNAQLARDKTIYTSNQEKGKLPDNWDSEKKNIVIFNSSEDEYASIGDEFDSLSLFNSQEEGIHFIIESIKDPKFHFYLRIHPNLKNVSYGYHTRLLKLSEKYKNITVINGHSSVSTYALMDKADQILVFGSTTGVEACYWNKPTILLGGAFYYFLDVAYTPKSKDELILLLKSNLEAKDKLGAIQYGFYLMDFPNYTTSSNNDPIQMKLFGRNLGLKLPYMKIWGSFLVYKIFVLVRYRIFGPLFAMILQEKIIDLPLKGK